MAIYAVHVVRRKPPPLSGWLWKPARKRWAMAAKSTGGYVCAAAVRNLPVGGSIPSMACACRRPEAPVGHLHGSASSRARVTSQVVLETSVGFLDWRGMRRGHRNGCLVACRRMVSLVLEPCRP